LVFRIAILSERAGQWSLGRTVLNPHLLRGTDQAPIAPTIGELSDGADKLAVIAGAGQRLPDCVTHRAPAAERLVRHAAVAAGNHDSGSQIGIGARVLIAAGAVVIGIIERIVRAGIA